MFEQVRENRILAYTEKLLLVVADLRLCFSLAGFILRKTPFDAFFAIECYQAIEMLTCYRSYLFNFDYQVPGMNGMELYDMLHTRRE